MKLITAIVVFVSLMAGPAQAQNTETEAISAADIMSPIHVANAMVFEMKTAERTAAAAGADFDQTVITGPFLALVNMNMNDIPDDPEEAAAWAEIAFLNFEAAEAQAAYRGLLGESGLLGDHIWRRYMQVQFRAFGEVDDAIALFDEYVERFEPRPENVAGSAQMIQNIASHYVSQGDNMRAARLILDRVEATPTDAAYFVFARIPANRELFEAVGLLDDARALIAQKRAGLSATLELLRATPQLATDDPYLTSEMPSWYWDMQGRLPGETFQSSRERQILVMVDNMDRWLGAYE